jgi:cysteine synthase
MISQCQIKKKTLKNKPKIIQINQLNNSHNCNIHANTVIIKFINHKLFITDIALLKNMLIM